MSGMDIKDGRLVLLGEKDGNALDSLHASEIAAMARELLAHRRASQSAPAPSDGLREAAERLERACDTIAGLRTREMYLVMVDAGQTNALDELDFARQQVRRHLRAAISASPAQEGDRRHD